MKANLFRSLAVLLTLLFSHNAFSQAPTITYGTVPTINVGTAVTLTPSLTGGAITINGQATTLAGNGTTGSANGTGPAASFNNPVGMVADAAGNIYLADAGNALIRKITTAGVVTTLAGISGVVGSANGTGTVATFNAPMGLGIDAAGNIYVADRFNYLIRKITPAGVVSTLAGNGTRGFVDGPAASAEFYEPMDVKVDAAGNVFVADYGNYCIRKITPTGVVSTVVGQARVYGHADGQGTAATLNCPVGLAFDSTTGNLVISDQGNSEIRVMTPGGLVSTLAGSITPGFADGIGSAARFNVPRQVAVDASGNIYVADYTNNRIRRITSSGVVSTLSGNGTAGAMNGTGSSAEFNAPFGACLDATGNLYVSDYTNKLIRKVAYAYYTLNQPLPAGLTFNASTGIVSGMPTTIAANANYSVTASNASGVSTATLAITVNAPIALALSASQNYITTYTPRVAGITASNLSTASPYNAQVETTVQYFDGLGRPIQAVQVKGSPAGNDMVQSIAYDQFGREVTKYLPYALTGSTANDGSYKTTGITDQAAFYATPPSGVNPIANASAQTSFEPSPLNRPVEQGASGAAWQLNPGGISHTQKITYTTNNALPWTGTSADTVNTTLAVIYNAIINADQSRTLVNGGNYLAGQLSVTVSKDENWISKRAGTMEEYKDKDGHVVLKRVYNFAGGTALQQLSTYYVYDDLGNLAFVLPPASGADSGTPTATTLTYFCYQYQYDSKNRLIQKQIPGKGAEYMVYNQLDQLVLSQDANQRLGNQWSVTKYDGQGRVILAGLWNAGSVISQATLQASIYAGAQWDNVDYTHNTASYPYGYIVSSYPALSIVLSVNYYDGYSDIPNLPATYTAPANATTQTAGLLVANRTAVLNTPANILWTVSYYDGLGRNVKTYKQHYLNAVYGTGNNDAITTTYNFTNQPTTVTRQHWTTASVMAPSVTIANAYIYDHMGRKLRNWEQIANGSNALPAKTLISQIDYNEVGQVLTKHLHSMDSLNFLQNIAYAYNERGWLLSSTAPLFAMQLSYNSGSLAQYNGNISYQYWGTPGNLNSYYGYQYDPMNRLLANASGAGNKENVLYDQMGNISSLSRYRTNTVIDALNYNYISGGNVTNQLQSVNDQTTNNSGMVYGTTNYTYDVNGNELTATNTLNTAQNKNFTYNVLNLPNVVTVPQGTLTYTYDAGGKKLRKVSVINGITTTTDYVDGIQYKSGSAAIDFIQTEEGRTISTGSSGYDYVYYLGDNLGNTRVTFDTNNGVLSTLQTDDYYPFGMEISGTVNGAGKNEYLYNRKELQEELTQYDYGARFYDPVIGRWNTIDPLAEKNRRWSPYNYVLNNPIRFTDPDGMDVNDIAAQLQRELDMAHNHALLEQYNKQTAADEATLNGHTNAQGGQCCTTVQDNTRASRQISKHGGIDKNPGTFVIIDGKKVFIKHIDKGIHEHMGSLTQTFVRQLDHNESLAFLDKEVRQVSSLNDKVMNIGVGFLNGAIGFVDVASAPIAGSYQMVTAHNFSAVQDQLQTAYNKIVKTDLGLIEITKVTNTEDAMGNFSSSSQSEYYIPNGTLVSTVSSDGN
jgi:RHS repeat-associated protein